MDEEKKSRKRKLVDVSEFTEEEEKDLIEILYNSSKNNTSFIISKRIFFGIPTKAQQKRVIHGITKQLVGENKAKIVGYWMLLLETVDENFFDTFTELADEYINKMDVDEFTDIFPSLETRKYWVANTTFTDAKFIVLIKQQMKRWNGCKSLLLSIQEVGYKFKNDTYLILLHYFVTLSTGFNIESLTALLDTAKKENVSLQISQSLILSLMKCSDYDNEVLESMIPFVTLEKTTLHILLRGFCSRSGEKLKIKDFHLLFSAMSNVYIDDYYDTVMDIVSKQCKDSEDLLIYATIQLKSIMFIKAPKRVYLEKIQNVELFPDCLICLIFLYAYGTTIPNLKEKELSVVNDELSFLSFKKQQQQQKNKLIF